MEVFKWKLKIKNIGDIKRIIIFSINQNNLINIVKEETHIFFYTLKSQKKVLMCIDDNNFNINLNESKKNYENNNIVKAILFYEKIGKYNYNNTKQNKINDRYIYSRNYNSLVPEYHNKYIFLLIRDILNNKYFGSDYAASFITYCVGYLLKSNISSFLIKPFIKHYNINTNKYIIKGPSFNDFFIRELKEPLSILKNNELIFSPASSRSILFNFKNYYKLKLYIKGKHFSVSKLLDEKKIQKKYSVAICRLAINDYHHIHMPEDGILIKMKFINGTHISVDKDYLTNEIDVLTDNKRLLLKFKREDGSIFYLIMVGSILIASIVCNLQIQKKYYTREKIAYFQYGGSCVVYFSDKNVFFDEDLIYYSNENIESYIKAGEEIGNINKQKKKLYIKNYNIQKHIIGFLNNLIDFIIKMLIKINKKYFKDFNLEIV
jgi:phosphatidylserine decarboxylase